MLALIACLTQDLIFLLESPLCHRHREIQGGGTDSQVSESPTGTRFVPSSDEDQDWLQPVLSWFLCDFQWPALSMPLREESGFQGLDLLTPVEGMRLGVF